MTHQQLYLQYNGLIRGIDLAELIDNLFLNAIKSGVLNIEQESEKSYRISQIILHAALTELADKFKPANPDNLMDSENLQRFL